MNLYEMAAIALIVIFLVPVLFFIYFIGRCLYWWIKERCQKKISKNDPLFGKIDYEDGYWHSTSKTEYFISIESTADDPTEAQRKFYLSIQNRLCDYTKSAIRYLSQQFPKTDFSLYQIYSVSIGGDDEIVRHKFSLEFGIEPFDKIYEVSFEHDLPISWTIYD